MQIQNLVWVLGRMLCMWDCNIKISLGGLNSFDVDLIKLAHNMVH